MLRRHSKTARISPTSSNQLVQPLQPLRRRYAGLHETGSMAGTLRNLGPDSIGTIGRDIALAAGSESNPTYPRVTPPSQRRDGGELYRLVGMRRLFRASGNATWHRSHAHRVTPDTPVLKDFTLQAAVMEDMNNKDILDIRVPSFILGLEQGHPTPTTIPPLSAGTCIDSRQPARRGNPNAKVSSPPERNDSFSNNPLRAGSEGSEQHALRRNICPRV